MRLGINNIKKEFGWFGLLLITVVLVEYIILNLLGAVPVIQFILQMVVVVFLISTIIKLFYTVWLFNQDDPIIQDENDSIRRKDSF